MQAARETEATIGFASDWLKYDLVLMIRCEVVDNILFLTTL